ncbi:hypothetical protein JB92DRAFT_3139908 [Gautieria morchelliformis]|nr:hypothetical protein JB92DRAFT_3139908 [Gautieria morchelliformis]
MISEGLDPKTVFHSIPNAATSPPVDNDPEDSDSGRSELAPPPSHYDPKHSHQPESMDIDSNSGDMSEDEEPSLTLGVKKTKGKQKQAPLPVPSAVNVSKKSATNSIKKAKRKIIEDSVEDGVQLAHPKEDHVKVVPRAPSTSAATADGARKSQRKVSKPMMVAEHIVPTKGGGPSSSLPEAPARCVLEWAVAPATDLLPRRPDSLGVVYHPPLL